MVLKKDLASRKDKSRKSEILVCKTCGDGSKKPVKQEDFPHLKPDDIIYCSCCGSEHLAIHKVIGEVEAISVSVS